MAQGSAERDRLIVQYLPMVRKVAYQMVRRCPPHVHVEDLISIGVLGLIDAADRYRPDRMVAFGVYARIRVQGAIYDELRRLDWVPRTVRDRNDRLQAARAELERAHGRPPTDAELADALGVDLDRLHELVEGSELRRVVSIDQEEGVMEIPGPASDSPDQQLFLALQKEELKGCLEVLNPRERQILDLLYRQDQSQREIAGLLGVTESRVSQIHSAILRKLRDAIREREAAA